MSKKRQLISKSQKKKILEESFKEGAVSSEVARKYGIRPAKLYTWRNSYKRDGNLMNSEGGKNSNSGSNSGKYSGGFVEVHLQNKEDVSGSKLQEVSFKFTDYVVQIRGRVDDKIIGSILKMSGIR